MEMFAFGKHAPYIWSSFGLTFAVLLANVVVARYSHRSILRELARAQGEKAS